MEVQVIPFQSILNTINLQINKLYGNITYLDFLVPAIIGMTILFGCVFGMGEIVAGERERGELARLFMTPTSVATVVGGKIISKLVQETGRGILLIVAAILLFGIIINGSIVLTILPNNPRSSMFYRIWNHGICKSFITRRFHAECNAHYHANDVSYRVYSILSKQCLGYSKKLHISYH